MDDKLHLSEWNMMIYPYPNFNGNLAIDDSMVEQ